MNYNVPLFYFLTILERFQPGGSEVKGSTKYLGEIIV